MLKFENRVALNKISRFIETNALVIFFHSKCSALEQKQKNLSRILNKNPNLYKKLSLSGWDEAFQVKAVKNKYLKKALLQKSKKHFHSSLFLTEGSYQIISLKETTFFLLKDLIEDDSICVLGGIYNNHLTDHDTLSHLAKIIEDDKIYQLLNGILKKQCLHLPSILYSAGPSRSNLFWLLNNFRRKLYFATYFLQKKAFDARHKS